MVSTNPNTMRPVRMNSLLSGMPKKAEGPVKNPVTAITNRATSISGLFSKDLGIRSIAKEQKKESPNIAKRYRATVSSVKP